MKVLAGFIAAVMVVVLGAAALVGGDATADSTSGGAVGEIPASLRPVYEHAAATCGGLPWQVLAAIGFNESRHADGRADPSTGDVQPPIVGPPLDGRNGRARIADPTSSDGWMHAYGPMQFLPPTWKAWARLAPGRPPGARPSPQNAWDAIYTAAAYLCGGRTEIGGLRRAIDGYAGSTDYYPRVIAKAITYGLNVGGEGGGTTGAAAVAVAERELGVPYVYGAASPAAGFDCSGLVVWAYAQVGVRLPRVTYDQVRVGTPIGSVAELAPGDLIFTRGDVPVRDFGHVAMYVGDGIEINAPHTGAVVSLRPIDTRRIQAIRRPT